MKRLAIVVLLLVIITLSAGCEKKIIVPAGTTLYRPVVEDNECVLLHGDYNSELMDDTLYSSTQVKHAGILTKVIECPYMRRPEPVKFTLVKTEQDLLLWVMLSDLEDG